MQFVLGITGMALTATGVLFFILSVLQMKDNWRAGVQREEYYLYKKKVFRYLGCSK